MKPASNKQKALIQYLGHPDPDTATAEEASSFIDSAINSEEYQPILLKWNTDKLKLHPNLYAQEVARLKAGRFQSLFEFCESERETYHELDPTYWPLKKLTLKVCKQAVEWLDKEYAGWDIELYDSEQLMGINEKVIESCFVPAIANVAPDFIKKERSGNPNPSFREKRDNTQHSRAESVKKPKRKRGCLWWLGVFLLIWLILTLGVVFFR